MTDRSECMVCDSISCPLFAIIPQYDGSFYLCYNMLFFTRHAQLYEQEIAMAISSDKLSDRIAIA